MTYHGYIVFGCRLVLTKRIKSLPNESFKGCARIVFSRNSRSPLRRRLGFLGLVMTPANLTGGVQDLLARHGLA
jgi:hypothetical protein